MKSVRMAVIVAGMLMLAACSPSVLTLDVGTCFDDPTESLDIAADDIPIVDCDTPHDNEVFANENLTGDEYPGEEELSNRADQVCLGAFDVYVGESYETSVYEISWLAPSAESWDAGDREVICFAFDMNYEKITGSINGIGQ